MSVASYLALISPYLLFFFHLDFSLSGLGSSIYLYDYITYAAFSYPLH